MDGRWLLFLFPFPHFSFEVLHSRQALEKNRKNPNPYRYTQKKPSKKN